MDKKNPLKNGHPEKRVKTVIGNDATTTTTKHISKDKKIEKLKSKEKKDDGAGSDSGKDSKKCIKTTTVKDMLRAKRDSMRNMIDSSCGSKSENTEDSEKESGSSDDSSESDMDDGPTEKSINGRSDIKLPENLPTDLLDNINKIVEASKSSGKNNFFDVKNMDLLYR